MKGRSTLLLVAPYLVLGAAAIAATWRLFATPGLPYNVDISGFFPLTTDAYEARFWPLWNERGGMSTLQFLPALLVELPFLVAGHVLGWGMDVHIKVRILFGFALAGASMYALARHYLERHAQGRLGAWALVLIPFAPALFFMFNPWSVHRVFHYFLWLGYAFAPLVILAFERLADSPGLKRALTFAAVAAIATTDPHNPPHFALLLAPFVALRLVAALRSTRAAAWRLTRALAFSAVAYLGFAAYWILPYVASLRASPGLGPTYVLSNEMIATLSRNANFPDALVLMHNYNPRASFAPEGEAALALWSVAGWLLVAAAFAAPLLARRGVAWVFAGIAVASVLLGLGTNAPMTNSYHWLIFDAPWGEGLSWLFRDPFRWGGFQALAYAALLTFALAELALRAPRAPASLRRAMDQGTVPLALGCVALFVLPGLTAYMLDVYDPVEIPSEYADANAFLATTPETAGVVWMPRMLGATTWSGERTLAYFDATSSARAALGPFRPATSTYFRLIEDAAKDGADLPPLLARAGIERVVFHNDRSPARDARVAQTMERVGLEMESRHGETPTIAIDQSGLAFADSPATRVPVGGAQEVSQSFIPQQRAPADLSLRAAKVGEPTPLEVTILDAAGANVATRRATTVEGGETRVDLRGVVLTPGKDHTLRLRAPDAPNGSRWDVSCYTVDTYAGGAVLAGPKGKPPCAGDLAFELQAVVRGFVTTLASDPAPRLRATAGALATADGLQMLRALSALPADSPLAGAGVVFTSADETSREVFARQDDGWHWVAGLDDTRWETIVPFLPASSFVAPFRHTASANGTIGWARGTEDFTYEGFGWRTSLTALGQESWDLDADRGIVYTSANASLEVPVPAQAREPGATVLARVYMHPKGGALGFEADTGFVGALSARDAAAGFRWVEIGRLPKDATTLRLVGGGSFVAVNQIAVVGPEALAAAQERAAERFRSTPVTLVAQAESVPALQHRAVAQPGVGRLVALNRTADVEVQTPAAGDYALWLRAPAAGPLPEASIDGIALGDLVCASGCGEAAPWYASERVRLAAGAHALTLSLPANATRVLLDALALTSEPRGLLGGPMEVGVAWERIDATRYVARFDAEGPVQLVLAQPSDAGWIARDARGHVVRSTPVDGIANAFLLDTQAEATIVITYEPQAWAQRGAALTTLAIALALVFLAFAARPRAWRRPSTPVPEDL